MLHQIKHKFSKFEQSNNLQLINFPNINFQSNNLHLFLLKGNRGVVLTTSCGGGGQSRQWLQTVLEIGKGGPRGCWEPGGTVADAVSRKDGPPEWQAGRAPCPIWHSELPALLRQGELEGRSPGSVSSPDGELPLVWHGEQSSWPKSLAWWAQRAGRAARRGVVRRAGSAARWGGTVRRRRGKQTTWQGGGAASRWCIKEEAARHSEWKILSDHGSRGPHTAIG
jgi:hypothetical protein